MSDIVARIADAKTSAIAAIEAATDLDALKEIKSVHVGDKSEISRISQSMGSVPADQKAAVGKALSQAREEVAKLFDLKQSELERLRDELVIAQERVDVTIAASRFPRGGIHPLTLLDREIGEIFTRRGYRIM